MIATTTIPNPTNTRTISGEPDVSRAIDTVLLAFSGDPAARWLFPEARRYSSAFPEFVRAFAGAAIANRTVIATHAMEGVAFWFAPGVEPDEKAVVGVIERFVPPERHADAFAVFEQMNDFHPADPHWYLPLIGVDPPCQGQGHGSALLCQALDTCDRARLPAYLEASSAVNLRLYQRHGFQLLGEIQSSDSPVIYPMRREPRS